MTEERQLKKAQRDRELAERQAKLEQDMLEQLNFELSQLNASSQQLKKNINLPSVYAARFRRQTSPGWSSLGLS